MTLAVCTGLHARLRSSLFVGSNVLTGTTRVNMKENNFSAKHFLRNHSIFFFFFDKLRNHSKLVTNWLIIKITNWLIIRIQFVS